MDGMPYFRIGNEPQKTVVIPHWIVAPLSKTKLSLDAMIQAVRREGESGKPLADKVVVVFPYFEARSDHPTVMRSEDAGDRWTVSANTSDMVLLPGETIFTELIAATMKSLGVTDVVVMDLHSRKALDDLRVHVPNVVYLTAVPLFAEWARRDIDLRNAVVYAPDRGSLARAELLARLLSLPFHQGKKYRPGHNEVEVRVRDGGDLEGKTLLTVDEVIDTFGTVEASLRKLKFKHGVERTHVFSTAGKFSGPAIDRLGNAFNEGLLDGLVLTNTLPTAEKARLFPKVQILDVANVFVAALEHVLSGGQPSAYLQRFLFEPDTPEVVEARVRKPLAA